jgi:hypothetical protein
MFVRVYYVGDIAPEISLEEISNRANLEKMLRNVTACQNCMSLGSAGGTFGGGTFWYVDLKIQTQLSTPIHNLSAVIQSLARESWFSFGMGGAGNLSICHQSQSFVILQTEEVHAEIEELLSNLRKMHVIHRGASQ